MIEVLPHTLSGRRALPLLVWIAAALLPVGQAPGQGLQGTSKRALNEVLQPSEAELNKRVTPVVRAVRSTADSVFSVFLSARSAGGLIGQGSGVIIDDKGLALTNWHVVANAYRDNRIQVQVKLRDNKTYPAKVLSVSSEYDLALLQLELPVGETVQPVTMGDSDSLMIGETVIAIGNPKGHQNTVTVGVLSAQERSIKVRTPDGRVRAYKGLLQTDAAINQGNSGGALLDITGKLVGINNAMASDSENIGFAIPVNTVRKVFNEVLLSSENITAVYLGMQVRPQADRMVINRVAENGPAFRAGVRLGDQLLKVNDTPVNSTLDYARSINQVVAGKPMSLTVRRNNRVLTHRPVPMSNAAWSVMRRIGIATRQATLATDKKLVETASREIYRELGMRRWRPLPSILVITQVEPKSPAGELKIKPGDVLLGIVDRIPGMFGSTNQLRTFADIKELNDALHVMANRYRTPEYTVWLLRDGEVLDGPLDVPRI